jgi:hypothetical protein
VVRYVVGSVVSGPVVAIRWISFGSTWKCDDGPVEHGFWFGSVLAGSVGRVR